MPAVQRDASAEVVKYIVTFDATWSAPTHPQDFPPNPHFSGLIGGTHNDTVAFWLEGFAASPGMELMAEIGSKTVLQNEVEAAIADGGALTVLSGGFIGLSPGSVSYTFGISDTHPLVTLVSMIAPSPDWFVGVSGLDLRDAEGNWRHRVVVALDPYDAGTDSGVTFTSADADTQPQGPVTNIRDGFPFAGSPPLGTFTFELITPILVYRVLATCLQGPTVEAPADCLPFDFDASGRVDLRDFALFQNSL